MSRVSKKRYTLHLHRTGSIFRESEIFFKRFLDSNSWETTRKSCLDDRILQKGSRNTETGILREIMRRYFRASPWLPDPAHLGQLLSTSIPERAKNQTLFVYTYHADPVIQEIFRRNIVPNLTKNLILRNSVVVECLNQLKNEADTAWSVGTLKKWTVKFKTMLREVGFLKDNLLTKPYIREESFSFFFLWLFDKTQSVRKSLKHEALEPLCLTEEDNVYLLKKGNEKGWWYFTEGAGVVEFLPRVENLRGWIRELG